MKRTDRVITSTFKVGKRYRCTLTIPLDRPGAVAVASAEWEPHVPRVLSDTETADYERGRDALVARLLEEASR